MTQSSTMKIWHQSLTDFSTVPEYPQLLRQLAAKTCRPDTRVDVHGVPAGTYPLDVAPISALRYRWIERLLANLVAAAALKAEREGYDAVAVSCFYDPVLYEARSLVSIPVVSALESSLLTSFSIGEKTGLVVLDGKQGAVAAELVQRYGFHDRISGIVALSPTMNEHELMSPLHRDTVYANLERAAQVAVDGGATVIVPAEGVLNALASSRGVSTLAGVPFIDGFAATLAHAEMLVQLRRAVRLTTSRVGLYEAPPRSLALHFEP